MEEAILITVADAIIRKLGSIALKDIGSLWGTRGELQELERTISTINDVLVDAEYLQT